MYPYKDKRRDISSNISLGLKEFPRVKPDETQIGGGVFLTLYPELSPNTASISF